MQAQVTRNQSLVSVMNIVALSPPPYLHITDDNLTVKAIHSDACGPQHHSGASDGISAIVPSSYLFMGTCGSTCFVWRHI